MRPILRLRMLLWLWWLSGQLWVDWVLLLGSLDWGLLDSSLIGVCPYRLAGIWVLRLGCARKGWKFSIARGQGSRISPILIISLRQWNITTKDGQCLRWDYAGFFSLVTHVKSSGVAGWEPPIVCAKLLPAVPACRDCVAGNPGAPFTGPPNPQLAPLPEMIQACQIVPHKTASKRQTQLCTL